MPEGLMNITVPITKIDTEKRHVFGWANVPGPAPSEPVNKLLGSAPPGSVEETLDAISGAWREQHPMTDSEWSSVIGTFLDRSEVIVQVSNEGNVRYWYYEFSKQGESYVFTNPRELEVEFVEKALGDLPKVDLQGDYIEIDDLEKAAYDYVLESRDAGEMHEQTGVGRLVESMVFTPEKIEKLGLPDNTPVGWWVGYHIDNDESIGKVHNGDLLMFSIGGSGIRSR